MKGILIISLIDASLIAVTSYASMCLRESELLRATCVILAISSGVPKFFVVYKKCPSTMFELCGARASSICSQFFAFITFYFSFFAAIKSGF